MDKGARDWLGDYLSRYDGTLLVVSHDENLLQAAVSSIAEVRSGNVELYKSRSHDQVRTERQIRCDESFKFYLMLSRKVKMIRQSRTLPCSLY